MTNEEKIASAIVETIIVISGSLALMARDAITQEAFTEERELAKVKLARIMELNK